MKAFFILYWGTFILGLWAVRSYTNYYRHHVLRHQYAERHKRRLRQDHRRTQMTLFH